MKLSCGIAFKTHLSSKVKSNSGLNVKDDDDFKLLFLGVVCILDGVWAPVDDGESSSLGCHANSKFATRASKRDPT